MSKNNSSKSTETEAIDQLEVEYVKVADLIPYANNAKVHTDEQVGHIVNSIEKFGFDDPIGVWTNPEGGLEIVEGHGRVLALERMRVEDVPVIRLDHLTPEQRRAYVHIHNQTTLESGFDWGKLEHDMASLPDMEWGDFGFQTHIDDIDDIDDLFEPAEPKSGDEGKTPETITVTCPECGETFEVEV